MTRWQRWFNKSFGANGFGLLGIRFPAACLVINDEIGAKELESFVLGMVV
jgi:hypothetical protein